MANKTGAEMHKVALDVELKKRAAIYSAAQGRAFRRGVLSGLLNEALREKLEREGF